MRAILTICLMSFFYFFLPAQQVIQSEELNIRSHVAFHLLGKIDDVILLYQDKGYEKDIVAFDQNMVRLSTRTPYFEKKRVNVLDLSSHTDSSFHIIYSYKEKSTEYLKINSYNKSVELIDSASIAINEAFQYFSPFQTEFSEDGSKVSIYKVYNNQEFRLVVYDIHRKETIVDETYNIAAGFLEDDLNQVILSNSGEFWMVLQHFNQKGKKEKHHMQILRVKPESSAELDKFLVPLQGIVTSDVFLSYNDEQERMGLFGLYSEKDHYKADGFFVLNTTLERVSDTDIQFYSFTDNTINDLYGKDAKDKTTIDNFVIADIIWRADGGALLIMEMSYDFYRRPNYVAPSYQTSDPFRSRAWTNHLNEDMLLYSISPDSKPEWTKVIYKRQKSQDDQGIYSSFFTFKTPSRLRLIFNDEIKTSNTVSEYIFDSTGRVKRNSLLNTEYQNLKLRIKDALQISSTELLVPSQRSGFLSLVKIDYSI
tara:strand:+ start:1763 stop:3208 length:1446 start_codon:yes stop_codon:yes gene_type:complete